MVVLPLRAVLFEEGLHPLGSQETEHPGARIQEQLRELPGQRRVKPAVHNIHGEPSLLALQDPRRQKLAADLPMKPFPTAITDLESHSQSLGVFHDSSIQIGNPNLEAVSHREL